MPARPKKHVAMANAYVEQAPASTLSANGQDFYVRRFASSALTPEPAVYIHGLGGCGDDGRELLAALSDTIDCIAPDLPGFGHSPEPIRGGYRPSDHAAAVADLVREEFGQRRVHIFGHSLGGATALQLAAANPKMVRTLTLLAPALPYLVPRLSNIHFPVIAVPGVGERITRRVMLMGDTEWRVRANLETGFANPGRLSPQRLADLVEETRQRELVPFRDVALLASLRGLLATYFETSQTRPWKLAEQIDAPVLLVYGRDDKLVNPKAAFRATRAFKNARVVVVSDAGHLVQAEHPDVVAQAWRNLLR